MLLFRANILITSLWLLLVATPDLYLRGSSFTGISWSSALTYSCGMAASFLLWIASWNLLKKIKNYQSGFAAWIFLFPGLAVLTHVYFWLLQFEFFAPNVAFMIVHPDYAMELVRNSFGWKAGLALTAILGSLIFLLSKQIKKEQKLSLKHLVSLSGGALIFTTVWILLLQTQTQYAPEPADLKGMRAIGQGTWLGVKQITRKTAHSTRFNPPPHSLPNDRPDLIFILNETLGAHQWAPWNGDRESSPEVVDFLQKYKNRTVWFSNAKTSSGATNVSMPAILTGLSPEHSIDEFSQAPFLWKEAEAYGYKTALFTSQAYKWVNYDGFYLGKNVKPMVSKIAEDYPNLPRVNDNGVDDPITVDSAIEFLKNTPVTQPIFLMLQLNSTHEPCYAPDLEKAAVLPVYLDRPRRCKAAARYVSREMTRFLTELEKSGRLSHALVIETSDHGSQLNLKGPARLDSYYESVATVPMFVHVPEGFQKMFPVEWRNLQNNAKKRVSNIDIMPTFLHALGKWPEMPDVKRGFRPALSGVSLFEPITEDRTLLMLNTNQLRDWTPKAFALYYSNWKLIAYEQMGIQLFDLARDPEEKHNLWNKLDKLNETATPVFSRFILRSANLRDIFEKSKLVQSNDEIKEH